MRPSHRMIAGLAAALVGACFDFGATMAGSADGGHDAPFDGSVNDTSVQADAGDAGRDTGRDTGPVVTTGFCATYARPEAGFFFCDDFDEHGLPGAWPTWGASGGTIVETDASAFSVPNSVVATTQPLTNGEAVDVSLRTFEGVPVTPATLTLSFYVEPLQIDATASAADVLAAIDFLDGTGDRYSIGLAINVANGEPALALGEQYAVGDPDGAPPTFVNHPLPPTEPLAMNAWSLVTIELDWGPSSLQGSVTVNGALELPANPLTMPSSFTPTRLQVGIGTTFVTEYASSLSPVWSVRYDNVVFSAVSGG
jgi:hypothetical protein